MIDHTGNKLSRAAQHAPFGAKGTLLFTDCPHRRHRDVILQFPLCARVAIPPHEVYCQSLLHSKDTVII